MAGEIINLNKARKDRARAEAKASGPKVAPSNSTETSMATGGVRAEM